MTTNFKFQEKGVAESQRQTLYLSAFLTIQVLQRYWLKDRISERFSFKLWRNCRRITAEKNSVKICQVSNIVRG